MNKTELINAMAEKAGLSKVDAKKALDAFVEAVSESLVKGDKVALIGFGTFGVTEKAARTGINPATKQKITIAAKKVVKFILLWHRKGKAGKVSPFFIYMPRQSFIARSIGRGNGSVDN